MYVSHTFSRENFENLPNEYYESKFTIFVRYYKCVSHLQNTCKFSGFLTDIGADKI
jgi:hypothetical protein